MITEIGIVAGEIWHYLDRYGEVDLDEMIENIEKPRDTILMSLGWLAREGHVVLRKSEEDFIVLLREQPV